MKRRRRAIAAVVLAGAVAPAVAPAAPPVFRDAHGIEVVRVQRLSDRLHEVRVRTAALPREVDVRILVPRGYDTEPARRRHPVLHLFHGTSGRAADWTTMGDAEATTAPHDLITVMPDAGLDGDGGGWFTDWVRPDARHDPPVRPRWETFHMSQLVPWVDANLRTVAARRGRAIFGLSQGGFGAMTYAARHPDRFLAAGAFSGAVTTTADAEAQLLSTPVIQAITLGLNRSDPDAAFGPRTTHALNWAARDPGVLAANLRGMDLRLTTRDGRPGPLDTGPPDPASSTIEAGVRRLTLLLHRRLSALGIPADLRDEGPGTHVWAYWARDLRDVVPVLARRFADPRPAPARIHVTSADARFTRWGWTVDVDRAAPELLSLEEADARGFVVAGSGVATVTTPARYRPRSLARVTLDGPHADERRRVRVDRRGRLTLRVPLGPGTGAEQFSLAAELRGGTRVHRTRVAVRAPRRAVRPR